MVGSGSSGGGGGGGSNDTWINCCAEGKQQ